MTSHAELAFPPFNFPPAGSNLLSSQAQAFSQQFSNGPLGAPAFSQSQAHRSSLASSQHQVPYLQQHQHQQQYPSARVADSSQVWIVPIGMPR
jgi:hypothetical protein